MEVQLQELIDKIKDNGVKAANTEKNRIISDAEKKAKEIIAAAEQKAKDLESQAGENAVLSEKRSREALQLASRDLILNISTKITNLFNEILLSEAAKALDAKVLGQLITAAINNIGKDGSFEIALSESDAKNFGDALKSQLASVAKGGITIKPTRTVDAGFRLVEANGAISYDFTNAVIAENLAAYVNPKLAEDIKKAAGLS
jgi:V/A-type H+/Na+-transporting ATPase subunit E